eukprot:m.11054 g.11054  ORF g.11054 m.11054 type:complete len:1062 (+) comp4367_c0_seq1:181-3366(+)
MMLFTLTLVSVLLCAALCEAYPSVPLPGYNCTQFVDITGNSCDISDLSPHNITYLAAKCNATQDCAGFNNNGYLKACVRPSCGAHITFLSKHPNLISCISNKVPAIQPTPSRCSHPSPSPAPSPPLPRNCSVTADRPDCNCSGVHPPFEPIQVPLLEDYHYPANESVEWMNTCVPLLVSVINDTAVMLEDPTNKQQQTAVVGGAASACGWRLLQVQGHAIKSNVKTSVDYDAVVEHVFEEWGMLAYLSLNQGQNPLLRDAWKSFQDTVKDIGTSPVILVREPVGTTSDINPPVYNTTTTFNSTYECMQDIDPTDWLGKIATSVSNNSEVTTRASISVMAPNPDSGLFGNPEELNKFIFLGDGTLQATPWGGRGPITSRSKRYLRKDVDTLWDINDYLPTNCVFNTATAKTKMGMMGRYVRAVQFGFWQQGDSSEGTVSCGGSVMTVSPAFADIPMSNASESIALIRAAVSSSTDTHNFSYFKIRVFEMNSTLVSVENLGHNGTEFFNALYEQTVRYYNFAEKGTQIYVPDEDSRYKDTATALLTMYMNLDRGLIPQYGGGKFWNTYNIYLPLDTLALNGALLAWGHFEEAFQYLTYFFENMVDNSTGEIIYNIFGCDSDADYGRLIQTYTQAATLSGNITWARTLLPIIHKMAAFYIQKRKVAESAYPQGHPLHGIVPGSPEHDICHDPGYFFSINVWYVRGLLDLHNLHANYPISINSTFEESLLPIATAWQADIHNAANFTAVRNDNGEGIFFLHPVVGSVYGTAASPTLLPGGNQSTCVERQTCFASMSAPLPNGGSNQHTNYANFRILSETLLAGVLSPEYADGIMSFRESHRGTLLGMTRFRDVLDDMPIVGYGYGDVLSDRIDSFHLALAGHTLNYLTRGTHWGTEQRYQQGITNDAYRNDCGIGGEDCSLCMVSSVASAYWIRWMLLVDDPNDPVVYLCRAAPSRWYRQTKQNFGVSQGYSRYGTISYLVSPGVATLTTNVSWTPTIVDNLQVTVRVSSGEQQRQSLNCINITSSQDGHVDFVGFHANNETAVFHVTSDAKKMVSFTFVATPCK